MNAIIRQHAPRRASVLFNVIVPLLLGALSVSGWSPFEYWYIAVFGYAGLCYVIFSGSSVWLSALSGLAFGLGLHAVGHGWMFECLYNRAGLSGITAVFATLVFMLYLASFSMFPVLIWQAITRRRFIDMSAGQRGWAVLTLSALLTLGEWGRSVLFNGFTSLSFGYAFIDTWLAGYAPLAGLFSVSFCGFVIAAAAAGTLLTSWRATRWPLIFALLLVVAGAALGQIEWATPVREPLSFSLIQTNVLQENKFNSQLEAQMTAQLIHMVTAHPARLIVTPETAFPLLFNRIPEAVLNDLKQFSTRTGSHIFLGVPTAIANYNGQNSVIQVAPGQDSFAQYNKVRLMPFGEYTPNGFAWFADPMNIQFKNLAVGKIDQPPFEVGSEHIGAVICHEDLIGREVGRWTASSSILINPSNLAWFDGTLAILQSIQIVRFRALESARPILRVASTGITAHIDHHGKVVAALLPGKEDVLIGQIQPVSGVSLYSRYGDTPIFVFLLTLILVYAIVYLKRKNSTL